MSNNGRNINWVIELISLLIYIVLFIVNIYSFDDPYHSNIGAVLGWNNIIISLVYFVFGFAIFNGIPIQSILKKEAYIGVLGRQILLGFIVGLVIALYIHSRIAFYPYLDIISPFLLLLTFISVLGAHFFKARGITKRSLKRLAVLVGIFMFFKVLPKHYIDDIYYRNHPEYLEALKKHLSDPSDMKAYEDYVELERQLIEKRKKD